MKEQPAAAKSSQQQRKAARIVESESNVNELRVNCSDSVAMTGEKQTAFWVRSRGAPTRGAGGYQCETNLELVERLQLTKQSQHYVLRTEDL